MSADNARRWDGRSRGHYEVWYLTGNQIDAGIGYWIRYTLEAPLDGHGDPYAQLWFAFFDARDPGRTFAINRRFPVGAMTAAAEPFAVSIGAARLTDGSCAGSLEGDGHQARWDLRWAPAARTHHHLPSVMYRRGGLGETTVLSPNLDIAVSGTLVVDGREIALTGAPGGQTHLWGKKHAHRWAWGHCNAFRDRPGAAFETLTVQLRRAGRDLPPLTIFTLYLDGEAYRFNQFRHTLTTRGEMGTGYYRLSGASARARIEAEFSCRPDDMVVAPYVDPDGEPSFCANTEIGDLRVSLYERAGAGRFRQRARLIAPRTAHFEVGQRERDPAIARDHVSVE